LIRYLMNSKKD